MIELRGLHLGNIARSPAESIRPDLWPDHAWVPALGCTGSVLYDLCGGCDGVSSSPDWLINEAIGIRGELTTNRFNVPLGTVDWSQPWTVVVTCKPFSNTDSFPFGAWNQDSGMGGWVIWRDIGDGAAGWSVGYAEGTEYLILGNYNNSGAVNATSTCAAGWAGGAGSSRAFLFADGIKIIGTIKKSSFTAPGPGNSLAVGGGSSISAYGDSRTFDGSVFVSSIYFRQLVPAQILDLTADPLLPFRRRQPVFYSVPSGGGSIETPAAMMMAL